MTWSRKSIGSDLTKVDAYENTAADYEEVPELTDEFFDKAEKRINGIPAPRGRPPLERPKKAVSLRLDQDVIDHFRSLGPGWQSKINETLLRAVKRASRT